MHTYIYTYTHIYIYTHMHTHSCKHTCRPCAQRASVTWRSLTRDAYVTWLIFTCHPSNSPPFVRLDVCRTSLWARAYASRLHGIVWRRSHAAAWKQGTFQCACHAFCSLYILTLRIFPSHSELSYTSYFLISYMWENITYYRISYMHVFRAVLMLLLGKKVHFDDLYMHGHMVHVCVNVYICV